jgi:hypothetical protein
MGLRFARMKADANPCILARCWKNEGETSFRAMP